MPRETTADKVLDTRGELCPMPVIKAKMTINALSSGQVLKLIASDPGSRADIPSWARMSGHQLVRQDLEDGAFVFWVKKG